MTRFDPFDFSARLDNGAATLDGVGTPGGVDALSGPHVNGQATTPPKAADTTGGKPEAHGGDGRRKRKDKATAKPRPRWWNVLASFVDDRLAGVSPGAVAVWLILFRNNHDGRVCISIKRIADVAGMSERSARYKIEELADAGIIEAKARGNRIKGPTVYRLNTESTGNGLPVDPQESTGNGLPPATGNGLPPFHDKRANADAERVAFASDDSDGNLPCRREVSE